MNSNGQSIGNISVNKSGAFSNPAVSNPALAKLNQGPLLLNENLARRADSQNLPPRVKEGFESQLSSIDKLLGARLSTLNELSSRPLLTGPAQSLEWLKVKDEIQSYLNGTASFIRETGAELDNLGQDLHQQKDTLSASDYLGLKGEVQALVKKKNELQKIFEKIESGSQPQTVH